MNLGLRSNVAIQIALVGPESVKYIAGMASNGKALTGSQITQFRERGFVAPVPALSVSEAVAARSELERREASHNGALAPEHRIKSHYLFPWVDDIMRNDHILDAVEDLIGPNMQVLPGSRCVPCSCCLRSA